MYYYFRILFIHFRFNPFIIIVFLKHFRRRQSTFDTHINNGVLQTRQQWTNKKGKHDVVFIMRRRVITFDILISFCLYRTKKGKLNGKRAIDESMKWYNWMERCSIEDNIMQKEQMKKKMANFDSKKLQFLSSSKHYLLRCYFFFLSCYFSFNSGYSLRFVCPTILLPKLGNTLCRTMEQTMCTRPTIQMLINRNHIQNYLQFMFSFGIFYFRFVFRCAEFSSAFFSIFVWQIVHVLSFQMIPD